MRLDQECYESCRELGKASWFEVTTFLLQKVQHVFELIQTHSARLSRRLHTRGKQAIFCNAKYRMWFSLWQVVAGDNLANDEMPNVTLRTTFSSIHNLRKARARCDARRPCCDGY